jgi:hypothetical protein
VANNGDRRMCEQCGRIINEIWPRLELGRSYKTPDLHKGKDFHIDKKTSQDIKIEPQSISVRKEAFLS